MFLACFFDPVIFQNWKNSLVSVNKYPKFDQLSKCLQNCTIEVNDRITYDKLFKSIAKKSSSDQVSYSMVKNKCVLCSNSHYLNQYSKFLSKNSQDRFEIVKRNRLCLICFNWGLFVSDYTLWLACKCGAKHNLSFHLEFKN